MADTIDTLKKLANLVRYASASGENTAERVGRLLVGILEKLENADIQKLAEHFLRKDQDDETKYFLKLLGGARIGKSLTFGDFITGMQGGYIGEDARAELEALVLRGSLSVPEIRFNR